MTELTEEQQKWVSHLENNFNHFPAGFARGLVDLFLKDPSFFEKDNIDNMKRKPVPQLDKTSGTIANISGEAAELLFEKMKENVSYAEVVPVVPLVPLIPVDQPESETLPM